MKVEWAVKGRSKARKEDVTNDIDRNLSWLKDYLGYGESFDIIVREFRLGARRAALVYIDSFIDSSVITLVTKALFRAPDTALEHATLHNLLSRHVPYVEISPETDLKTAADQILAGPVGLVVDGVSHVVVLDVRKYPDRSPSEPSMERVMRGPHDGFIETLVFNTVLIRRRLRDPNLRVEAMQVGRRSKSDVAVLYLKDVANPYFVRQVRKRLKSIDIDAMTMSERSLSEWIVQKPWYNPFPLVKFTERPDVAAEHITEGHILVMIDATPNAIILPVTFFSFLQSIEEYHEDVMVGTYLKWIRFLGLLFSWVGPPLWFALFASGMHLPGGWDVLLKPTTMKVPIFWQLVGAEIGVDFLRLALMFSPSPLTQSMGFLGAILLGNIAVKANLIDAEVIVYVAIAAVGTFTSPDFDFGLSIRLLRFFLLLVTGVGLLMHAVWAGFAIGVLIPLAFLAQSRSFGMSYLWPLIPFNGNTLFNELGRKPLNRKMFRPNLTLPRDRTHQPPPRKRMRRRPR